MRDEGQSFSTCQDCLFRVPGAIHIHTEVADNKVPYNVVFILTSERQESCVPRGFPSWDPSNNNEVVLLNGALPDIAAPSWAIFCAL